MLNNITIMGRLVRDVESRTTTTGKNVASFTLAVDRDYDRKTTDFFNCVAWNKTGEFVQNYFHKGNLAVVAGAMQSRNWNDKDGNKHQTWEVNVSNIYFGESKKTADVSAAEFVELGDGEELPF